MNLPIQQLPSNLEPEDKIDLAKYLNFLSANRWLIAGVALAVVLLGAAYALIAQPIYEASILIHVEESAGQQKGMPGDISGAFDIKTGAPSEMEIIRSRTVVSRAVENSGLDVSVQPKYFPVIGQWLARGKKELSEPGLLGYGGYVWGGERAEVSIFKVPEDLQGRGFVLTAEEKGIYLLTQSDAGIAVRGRVGQTLEAPIGRGAIVLRVDRLAARPGAQFLLSRAPLVEAVEALQKSLRISEKGKQSGIIGVALAGPEPKKAAAILNEIGREYVRQNVYRKSEEAEKSLAFLNRQLPDLKQQLERSESRYNELRNKRGTIDVAEEGRTLLDRSSSLQARMVDMRQKKEELLTRFTDAHPSVELLNQQMRELEREMAGVEGKIKKLPAVEQDVSRSNREVKVNTELYTALLGTAQQLRLAAESKVGNARLLDAAVVPVKPVKPQRSVVILLAGALGLVLGVAAAFLKKSLYGRVDDPREIEQLLGLTVSATIPHSDSQKQLSIRSDAGKVALLSHDAVYDSTLESLRRLRTLLQFGMLDAKNNIVMITGPTPGVGKSFVSANFAAVMAAIGKKVLLIDGDLRTGHLHRYFGLARGAGLSDAITGRATLDQVIHRGVVENVDFMSTGSLPRKPAELLSHKNFSALLKLFSTRYDFVLVDTPPVLAVSDALIIASQAGAIFNIVRGGLSTVGEIEETVKRLNQAGHTVSGVVFNDLKPGSASRYHYAAAYGAYRFAQAD